MIERQPLRDLSVLKVSVLKAAMLAGVAILLLGTLLFVNVHYNLFPYRVARDVKRFVQGHPDDPRSLLQRFLAEFRHDPAEFAARDRTELLPPEQLTSVQAKPDAGGVMPDVSGMRFYSSGGVLRYFVVFGSFAFPDRPEYWGALAIDSSGVVHRGWAIRPDRYEYLGGHIGLALTDDGLLATNAHGVLTGFDWCGEKRWEAPWSPAAGWPASRP